MRYLIPLIFLVSLCAQQPQQEGGKKGRPSQPPKNLKVLKVEQQDLIRVMRTYTTGLGVKCEHCHVQGDFASDENPQKELARMMIKMVQDVNGRFPDAKEHVTCYTCHRGEEEPKTAPPAPAAPPK